MLLECLKYLHEEAKMPLTEDTMIEAAGFGEIEIMRYLVEKKCPIGSDGRAISRAAEDGDLESVKYLYEIGAPVNINAQRWLSKWGYTPDMYMRPENEPKRTSRTERAERRAERAERAERFR